MLLNLSLLATDFVFICSGFSTWHRRISCIWNCQCKFQIYTILSYVFASLPSVRPWMRSSIVPACVPWWGHRECKRPYTFPSLCCFHQYCQWICCFQLLFSTRWLCFVCMCLQLWAGRSLDQDKDAKIRKYKVICKKYVAKSTPTIVPSVADAMLADATLANDSCRRWRRRRRSSPRPTKALLTTRSCRRRARPARGRRFQGSSKRITTLFCNRNRGPHLPAAAGSTGQVRPTYPQLGKEW